MVELVSVDAYLVEVVVGLVMVGGWLVGWLRLLADMGWLVGCNGNWPGIG